MTLVTPFFHQSLIYHLVFSLYAVSPVPLSTEMHIKHEGMIFISMLVMSNMIDLIVCQNKRIKIYVPQHIKHVHHHHVKKVPVYIVTKDKPRVMHASHIEDDVEDLSYKKMPRIKVHPDYDDFFIQGIYKGDESHVHEDIDSTVVYTTPQPQIEVKKQKLPYILTNSQQTGVRYNRLKLYDY